MAHLAATERQHVRTVDFARGVCAIGVCAYHILYYERIANLEIISLYAVYAFFVISGFAMYVAYRNRLADNQSLRTYFLRRFWRIAPLFYTANLIHLFLRPADFSVGKLVLNGMLALGLANPGTTSIVTGGWSIGIEMVFYILFPGILAAAASRIRHLALLFGTALIAQFAFVNQLYASGNFDWVLYTQPIAFVGYFVAGCLLGEIYRRFPIWKGAGWWFVVAALALVPFAVVEAPTSVDLLIGWRGALLTLATIILITAVAFMPEPAGLVDPIAQWFGRMSYPIYLTHPLAYIWVSQNITGAGSSTRLVITVAITVALSEVVHRGIERPAIRYSRG